MEHRVGGLHRVGELVHEGVGTWMHDDLKWSKIFVSEFLGGAYSAEVLSLHIDCISDCEVWQR